MPSLSGSNINKVLNIMPSLSGSNINKVLNYVMAIILTPRGNCDRCAAQGMASSPY
ncbi:hypothetical protein Mapa_015029 [Marchantia paleacea]|nr:hypothetical protein Mapa_015029 [Marchantia paleacea]